MKAAITGFITLLFVAGCDLSAGDETIPPPVASTSSSMSMTVSQESPLGLYSPHSEAANKSGSAANRSGGNGINLTIETDASFNGDGSGTVTVLTQALDDPRQTISGATLDLIGPSAPTNLSLDGNTLTYHVNGGYVRTTTLENDVRQSLTDFTAASENARSNPAPVKNYGPMPEAEFIQELNGAGYSVQHLGGSQYELNKHMSGPSGETMAFRLVMDKETSEIVRSEIYRDGHLQMSHDYGKDASGTHTVEVTAYPRGEDGSLWVQYSKDLGSQ
jgi:hypothetical protein